MATSALREAANKAWLVDQIALHTGFQVHILNNTQERALIFKALRDGLKDYASMRQQGLLLIDVGYGSTEIAEFREDRLLMSRNILLGALRLWEMTADIAQQSERHPQLLEEYITSSAHTLRNTIKLKNIAHCAMLSVVSDQLLQMAEGKITRKRFSQLYERIKNMTPQQIEFEYNIPTEQSEILLPTFMVVRAFLDITNADSLHLATASLADGVLMQMRDDYLGVHDSAAESDIISQATNLARQQHSDKNHTQDVIGKVLDLFTILQPMQKLKARDRLLLQLAAILHDTSEPVSLYDFGEPTAHILVPSPIIGLSTTEHKLLAFISRHFTNQNPNMQLFDSPELDSKARIHAIKLLSMLRLADALDFSHKQKLSIHSMTLQEDTLTITAVSNADAFLEQWIFERRSDFFEQIFGIRVKLKIKRGDLIG